MRVGYSIRLSQRVKHGQILETGKKGYANDIYVLKYYFDCYEKNRLLRIYQGHYKYEARDDGGLTKVEVRGIRRSNQISNMF